MSSRISCSPPAERPVIRTFKGGPLYLPNEEANRTLLCLFSHSAKMVVTVCSTALPSAEHTPGALATPLRRGALPFTLPCSFSSHQSQQNGMRSTPPTLSAASFTRSQPCVVQPQTFLLLTDHRKDDGGLAPNVTVPGPPGPLTSLHLGSEGFDRLTSAQRRRVSTGQYGISRETTFT